MSRKVHDVALTVIDGGKSENAGRDYLTEVFGEGQYLSKLIDGYKPRNGQIEMARTIDSAIREGRHVIVEGPTGTGKSLAYSTPASFHAAQHKRRICFVTANKNLQRQIFEKDLALLSAAVPWTFTYAVRKGISSYLCQRNFLDERWKDLQGTLSEEDEAMVHKTVEWGRTTSTGDFEESPGPGPKLWFQFATSRDECDGKRCSEFENCYVAAAKEKAANADIIVTNYHLLFLHLRAGEESRILPAFDVIILDEAHRAAKIAREFFGEEITFNSIYRCITKIHLVEVRGFRKRGEQLRMSIMAELKRVWVELAAMAKQHKSILTKQTVLDSEPLERLLVQAEKFYTEAAAKTAPLKVEGRALSAEEARRSMEAESYDKLAGKCLERSLRLQEFRLRGNEGMVYFLEGSGDGEHGKWVKLKSKAIEVAGYLHHGLFKRFPTVVQTSATLAIRGDGKSAFAHLRREMGMNGIDNVSEIIVESPFDWVRQGLLVIPSSMPMYEFGNDSWDKAVCEHLETIVEMVKGRTLGLFTSFRMLQQAAVHLRRTTNYPIYAQGEATNRELVAKFKREVSSVLLGTESFSEGISVEGEACTCVVLDKIPFCHKDDPVMYGIEQRMKLQGSRGSSFALYSLPEAIISLKQRVGRLIRTVNDIGVVVVLDKRLHTKQYRKQFIQSVPFDRVYDTLDAIPPFLCKAGVL